jgi:hypothetical protein
VGEQVFDHLVRFDRSPVVHLDEQVVLLLEGRFDLFAQDRFIEQVLYAHADPVHLVRVRRTYAAAGGANPSLAEKPFGDLIDHLVIGGDDVRIRRNHHVGGVHAARRQLLDFGRQYIEVHHDPVADHRNALGIQDSGRQQVEGIAFTVHHDRVAGVVAAGVPDAVVDSIPKLIGRLTFAFVAPLGAHHHNRRHVIAVLLALRPERKTEAPGHSPRGLLRQNPT